MIEQDSHELLLQLKERVERLERAKGSASIELKVMDSRLGTFFPLPCVATKGAAAVDLRAMIAENKTLQPGEVMLIPTGFAVNMQDPRYCALIIPRSGLGHKNGIVLRNLVGLIDSDYQGQIQVSLINNGNEPFEIQVGDRIAQLMFTYAIQPEFTPVEEFSLQSERGEGGFGHSGRR